MTKNLQRPTCARQTNVAELREQGLTFEQIAQALGISRQSAHRSFKRYEKRGGGDTDQAWSQFALQSAFRGMEDEDFSAYDNIPVEEP